MDSTLMLDRETGRPRGYGFVTYENDATVENLLRMDSIVMDGKMVSFSLMPVILSEAG